MANPPHIDDPRLPACPRLYTLQARPRRHARGWELGQSRFGLPFPSWPRRSWSWTNCYFTSDVVSRSTSDHRTDDTMFP